MATARAVLAGLLLALPLGGCVERRFLLRTEPEGARVMVNGVFAGVTPVDMTFEHYGKVRIEVEPMAEEGGAFADWRRLVTAHDLRAPWYEWFPLDFFSDNLLPWTIVDRHEATFRLQPAPDPDRMTEEELKEMTEEMKRLARELRIRAGKSRTEAEVEAPPPVPPAEGKGK